MSIVQFAHRPVIHSVTVRKRVELTPVKVRAQFELELEISALNHGKEFHNELASQLGLMPAFVGSDVHRSLGIDAGTARPATRACKSNLMVPFEDPIVLYAILKAKDNRLRVGIIGTTKQTYFVICKESSAYYFIIAEGSVDAKEAVVNLYANSLHKGSSVFNRTTDPIYGFFSGLFGCVADELVVHQFTVKSFGGTIISARVYIDPHDVTKNMISVSGLVQNLDLDEYPSEQIQRGYFGRPQLKSE